MSLSNRRQFLARAAGLVTVLTGGFLFGRCGFLGDDEVTDRTFRTEEASSHTHSVTVLASDMRSPPSTGATYTTTETDGHTHTVDLDADQLRKVASYSSFTATSSEENGHTHDIIFK